MEKWMRISAHPFLLILNGGNFKAGFFGVDKDYRASLSAVLLLPELDLEWYPRI